MTQPTVTPPPGTIIRPASQLAVGDRIAATFLPSRDPAVVLFVLPYTLTGRAWVFVVHRDGDHSPEVSWFGAEKATWLKSVADTGLSYSREPESTVVTPVPAGVDGHPEGGRVPELAYVAPTADGGMAFALRNPDPIGVIEGDTADEQRDNAYARYERDA